MPRMKKTTSEVYTFCDADCEEGRKHFNALFRNNNNQKTEFKESRLAVTPEDEAKILSKIIPLPTPKKEEADEIEGLTDADILRQLRFMAKSLSTIFQQYSFEPKTIEEEAKPSTKTNPKNLMKI